MTRPAKLESFSLPLFAFTVVVTLASFLALLRLAAPATWTQQILASPGHGVAAFLALSFGLCLLEYFFHRYVLHRPLVPLLRQHYRQHTLHHSLTRIGRRPGSDGGRILVIENKFPIVEPEQGEASFFPWYTLTVFVLLGTPLFVLLQWLWPAFPWFFAGFLAFANSLVLYEIFHAINHWSLDRWEPLLRHPRWGRVWQAIYGFHLRHHAVIDCNESVSGFFGLPLADWLFRTCIIPQTLYADGERFSAGSFAPPQPRWPIRTLDAWAQRVIRRRRLAVTAPVATASPAGATPARVYSRAEEFANWITHGIGLALSIVGLSWLVVSASLHGNAWHVVSFTVFGLTLLVLYTVSTLYHSRQLFLGRNLLRRLDHAAIFLLIAGTYTPFLLTNLRGPWGWSLFGVIWGLCGAGAVFKLLFGARYRVASTVAYLFLGWLIVVALGPLLAYVPRGGLWLLLAGGLCYTIGVIFYHWQRLRFHHAVWHIFVLGGSTCHLLAVLLLVPGRA